MLNGILSHNKLYLQTNSAQVNISFHFLYTCRYIARSNVYRQKNGLQVLFKRLNEEIKKDTWVFPICMSHITTVEHVLQIFIHLMVDFCFMQLNNNYCTTCRTSMKLWPSRSVQVTSPLYILRQYLNINKTKITSMLTSEIEATLAPVLLLYKCGIPKLFVRHFCTVPLTCRQYFLSRTS